MHIISPIFSSPTSQLTFFIKLGGNDRHHGDHPASKRKVNSLVKRSKSFIESAYIYIYTLYILNKTRAWSFGILAPKIAIMKYYLRRDSNS